MDIREWDDYCVRRNLQDENYLKNHMKLHREMTEQMHTCFTHADACHFMHVTRSHYVSRASLSGQINDKI